MKRNWEYKKLTDVCSIQYGYPFESGNFTNEANGMPLIRIRDVKDGQTETYYEGPYPAEYIVHKGEYLIGMDGEFNIAPWKSDDALLNQRVCKITAKEGVFVGFLYRFLVKELKRIEDETPFVTVKHLSAKRLNQVTLPVPPLEVQSRIVAELDLLTGIIDKQNAQLKELDNLAQAIFYDMFGDLSCDECALIELCVSKDDIKCGPFGTQLSKSEYQKEGVAVWGIPQINSHFIIPPSDYVSQEKAVALKDYSVVAGDIVMSRKGNVGQCSVFPDSFENGIIHSDVLRLRLDYNKANSIFMMYQLHLSDSIKHQIQLVSSGAIMPGINVTKLKNIKVQVPPLALQQSFAEKIQSIEKQKETIRASIADTQKLLDYTMDKYFG